MKNFQRNLILLTFSLIILLLSSCQGPIDPVRAAKNRMENVYTSLWEDIDKDAITEDLNFPPVLNGVNMTYQSDNPHVITNQGKVTRGAEDVEVSITITLSYNNQELEKTLTLTVLKNNNEEEPEEPIEEPEEPTDPIENEFPISLALAKTIGETVTVQGVIIGQVGESAYLHDGKDGIYLYRGLGSYPVGSILKVTGKRAEFEGLNQLTDLSIEQSDIEIAYPTPTLISSLGEIQKQATIYDINELTITKLPTSYIAGKNLFIEVEDPNHLRLEIVISKYLSEDTVSNVSFALRNAQVGDRLSIKNIISGYYQTWQLQLVEETELVVVSAPKIPVAYYPDATTMEFLQDRLIEEEIMTGLSSIGETKVLIIPVEFTDYQISDGDLARLEKAFFGTPLETGWESVQSFYNKSSYQNFSLNGNILEPFNTGKKASYYTQRYNAGYDADYEIIQAALKYYDAQIDYSEYDSNNDGYIDGIYFIYSTPVCYPYDENPAEESDLWWAYVYQYFTEDYEFYDGVEANYYLWAGIDFMDEVFTYDETDDYYISINASTYIHETGHMLGLDDYYDYDEEFGPDGGLGGADMMDYNVGDHNPFSKIMLNWTTPYVVSNTTTTLTLNSFTSSGDVVLVTNDWHNSYFDEYILIDFYTPTELNQASSGFHGLYSEPGIRIIHVDARIDSNVGSPLNENGYFTIFSHNNSDTDYKILKVVEADNDRSTELTGFAENDDLFQAGDLFGENYRFNDGTLLNFTIEIVAITNDSATITIHFQD